jgi:hypothetical protein
VSYLRVDEIRCIVNEVHGAKFLKGWSELPGQEFACLKVQYFVHTSLSLDPILHQLNPVRSLPLFKMNVNVILYLFLPNGLIPSGFLIKILYASLIYVHATCVNMWLNARTKIEVWALTVANTSTEVSRGARHLIWWFC